MSELPCSGAPTSLDIEKIKLVVGQGTIEELGELTIPWWQSDDPLPLPLTKRQVAGTIWACFGSGASQEQCTAAIVAVHDGLHSQEESVNTVSEKLVLRLLRHSCCLIGGIGDCVKWWSR